jgi:hypothetical protein
VLDMVVVVEEVVNDKVSCAWGKNEEFEQGG